MQLLAREFAERAERAPDHLAVIDALGEHSMGEVMQAARDLAIALEESIGGSPTVLVQADNTWRTLATALAVGMRGGMVTVLSSHAVAAELELAMEDIEPDAVVASDGVRLDVLHRQLELRRNGMTAEHGDHSASHANRQRGRQRPPGVVGLDQDRRRPPDGLLERDRKVARRLHDLTHGVLAERVDDGQVIGCAFGTFGELAREKLHLSSWVQC